MKIEITCEGKDFLSIDKLKNFQGNLKELQASELEKLKWSIQKHGFSFPVFIWRNFILDGHQRIFAVRELLKDGHTIDDIPVVKIKAKSKSDAAEKLLMLNSRYAKITDDGLYEYLNEYDLDIMTFKDGIELAEINMDDFISGWLTDDQGGLTDDDEVPDVPEEPVSKLGDLYVLGEHRLLCGDATKQEDVERLMDGEKADMVLTDPPYGMRLDADYSKMPTGSDKAQIKGTKGKAHRPVRGDDKDFNAMPIRKMFTKTKEQFWFGADYYNASLDKKDTDGSWVVWDKRNKEQDNVVGSGFELCWSAQKHQRRMLRHYWVGAFGSAEAKGREHPNKKPTSLFVEIITLWAKGEIVADLFGGSGSTLIACEKTDRKCYMMEIDPHYCDVIVKRWEDYTGKKARLA